MYMLDENVIRNIIGREREFMVEMNDPVERKCCGAFIAGLECALND